MSFTDHILFATNPIQMLVPNAYNDNAVMLLMSMQSNRNMSLMLNPEQSKDNVIFNTSSIQNGIPKAQS